MVTIILQKNPSYIPLNLANLIYGISASYLFESMALVIFSGIVSFFTLLIIESEHKKNGVKVVLKKSYTVDANVVYDDPKLH